MQFVTRNLGIAVAGMLAITAGSAAHAANAPGSISGAQVRPIGQVQELGEIWVRGRRLSDRIEDAEDDFFRLYNKLNKKNTFDVSCADVRLNPDSLVLSRTCLPQFLGGYYPSAGAIPSTATSACASGNFVSSLVYGSDGYGGAYVSNFGDWYTSGTPCSSFNSLSSGTFGPAAITFPETSRTKQQRQDYGRNVMRAIYRDQRLLDKAIELAGLYEEMSSIQNSYARVKAENAARKEAERLARREKRHHD